MGAWFGVVVFLNLMSNIAGGADVKQDFFVL